jgi:hypothetical protein
MSSSISAIEAAQNCVRYLKDFQDLAGGDIQDLRLEEVESDENFWFVTLGYNVPVKARMQNPLLPASTEFRYERVYKRFQVNKATGEVESMKIRQP